MADRQRVTVLWIVLLLLFFGGGLYVSARLLTGGGVAFLEGRKIAILPLEGVLVNERSFLSHLDRFRRNGSVRGFVVEIRSPGGTVGAAQSLYRTLRTLREEDDRPIIAWIGDVGASGGYYVALAADSIFALPGSITGSIGVIMEFPNAQELLRKVGVGVDVVKSGEHKDMGSPAHPLTDKDREILERVVGDVYEQFVDVVVANRQVPRDSVLRLADGRIFSGERASELGLIDGIGTLDEAVAVAGRMAGLGDRPATVRPGERRLSLLDLVRGIPEGDLRGLAGVVRGMTGAGPRLLYEWR
ncbi:MAG: signal peptide peptidase SppA [Gemmatimonadota bacterium]